MDPFEVGQESRPPSLDDEVASSLGEEPHQFDAFDAVDAHESLDPDAPIHADHGDEQAELTDLSSSGADHSDPFSGVAHVPAPAPDVPASLDSFSSHSLEHEETPLSVWERDREIVLRDRASGEEREKASLLVRAQEELEKFYADESSRLEATKKRNRADEKNSRQDMKHTFESGTRWEKVNKLVNLQAKASDKGGQHRVERFKKLLIQLKSAKDKADDRKA